MLMIEFEGVELSFRGVARCVVSFRSKGETFFSGVVVIFCFFGVMVSGDGEWWWWVVSGEW